MNSTQKLYLVLVSYIFLNKVVSVKVTTSVGDLEGGSFLTSNGKEVFTFLAVPYGEPPIGEDRFSESKPAKKWNEVRQAKELPPHCYQNRRVFNGNDEILGDENCLFLNVYTKNISNTSNYPVLVYFHGGAFKMDSSRGYKSDYLLAYHDLVFVTVNYRLGPLGFLSTEDEVVPGNNGLKDQTLSLKWVRDNIAAFGGDPNKVTISGHSAGGASVHYHYLSPISRGLFIRGIMSSGSALNPWAFTESPLTKTKLIAEAVNCSTISNSDMVKCLRQRSAKDILSTMPLFMPWLGNPFSLFGPVIEHGNRNSFLAEHPYKLMKSGKTFDGPLLISLTTEEGLSLVGMFIDRDDRLKALDENWNTIAPYLLAYNYTISTSKHQNVSEKVRKHYLGEEVLSTKNTDKIVRMVGDRHFDAGINLAARLQASVMKSPVYMFTFGYRGNVSLSDRMTKTKANFGVSHMDDLYYILALAGTTSWLQSDSDQAMIQSLTKTWGSFVKTGKPEIREDILWQPLSQDSLKTGEVTHVVIHGPQDMMLTRTSNIGDYQFWSSLGLYENEHIFDSEERPASEPNSSVRSHSSIFVMCLAVFVLYLSSKYIFTVIILKLH